MTLRIRTRLIVWYGSVVVVVLVSGAIAGVVSQSRLQIVRLDEDVSRTMGTLQGVMRTEINEGLTLQEAADEASTEVVAPDFALAVAATDGRPLAVWGFPLGTAWQPSVPPPATPVTATIGSHDYRVLTQPVTYRGHDYVAAVLAPLDEVRGQQADVVRAVTVGVIVALVAAALGGWLIGRQTLRPLTDMAEQTALITAHTPAARLTLPPTDDELGQLATAFNSLLDRLSSALIAQRQFMADASHEMRTPVSIVRTAAQVTLSRDERTDEEYREALQIVSEQTLRLSRLVDAMFLLSRAEAGGVPLHPSFVYVDDLVEESARGLRVLAADRGVSINTNGDSEVGYTGDAVLLARAITNLLDNAVRFAQPNGVVATSLRRGSDAIVLRISDDGPGVPEADRERIFQRFARGGGSPGAGLGLPIARWIAEAHGGRLTLESNGSPRTCFALVLPTPEREERQAVASSRTSPGAVPVQTG